LPTPRDHDIPRVEKLSLRLAHPTDARAIAELYAPYVRESAVTFELEPPDIAEIQRRIAQYAPLGPWLVAEEEGKLLGYAYVSPFRARPAYRWTAETTVYLKQGSSGQGIGTQLYSALLTCMKMQGLVTAIGGITLPNERSVRLHGRLGFHQVGLFPNVGYKFSQWHDVGFWAYELNPPTVPVPEPRTPANLQNDPEWIAALQGAHSV
jgi:phosphinothricin acetyltransferase